MAAVSAATSARAPVDGRVASGTAPTRRCELQVLQAAAVMGAQRYATEPSLDAIEDRGSGGDATIHTTSLAVPVVGAEGVEVARAFRSANSAAPYAWPAGGARAVQCLDRQGLSRPAARYARGLCALRW